MEDNLVTLAILTFSKAQVVKNVLENEGIEAYIHNVNQIQPVVSSGVRLKIKDSDLPKALKIVESSSWLSDEVVKEEVDLDKQNHSKAILIPIDFSDYSVRACEFGFRLADRLQTEIVLMHVYFNPVYMPSLQYATESYRVPFDSEVGIKIILESVQHKIDDFKEKLEQKIKQGEVPDVKYTIKLREGVPEEEIIHYARRHHPVMIVMGSRGEGEKELEIIGSVTAEVIDRSPVSVYAIPKNAEIKGLNEIGKLAFLTNFDQRDLISFDTLITTLRKQSFEISFLNVNPDVQKKKWNEIQLVGIKEYFKKLYPQFTFTYDIITDDNFLNNLDEYVEHQKIDVLCLSNYKRNIFARIFNPSIARKMIFHSSTPILVVKLTL